VLIVVYVAVFGSLSLRRHQNLRTNALDLGYTDQAVWNTLHGRPLRFSTYLDAAFRLDIPIHEFKEPDMLLGYHVEPILVAIAPLYLIHNGPETLLWLQTIVIALGAIPLYLIVRHRIEKRQTSNVNRNGPLEVRVSNPESRTTFRILSWLPVAFVVLYLLSPQLEAANLSDFHAVALSPALLLAAFYFLETDRPWGFVAFAFLAAMCKEEIGLLVAMMGLWAAFVRRRWWLGLGVFVAGGGWFLLSVQAIIPYFSGLSGSAFLVRYGHLGDSLVGVTRNLVQRPGLFVDWLRRPDVVRYLRDLWLSSGGLAILHPLSLVMSWPSVAINTLSRYGWMRSGGGHYSAAIVPFLVIAAAYGMDWLAWQTANGRMGKPVASAAEPSANGKCRVYAVVSLVLVGFGLIVALAYHYQNGISPMSRRYALESGTEHARRAEPLIEWVNSLPPQVPISVGSNLYPHVGHRERVYLFPTISDARVILLDTTGPSSPVSRGDQAQIVRELLDYAQFGIAESDHGLLLLERGLDQYRLSPAFYQTFLVDGAAPQVPVGADFGGVLRLEGFDWVVRPVVRPGLVVAITTYWRALSPVDDEYRLVFYVRPVVRPGLVVAITTYWRALSPVDDEYRLVFFFWDKERRLVRVQPEEQALQWYPTWLWEPGQVVKVTLPALPVGDLPLAGVAVLRPAAEPADVGGRLVPITPAHGQPLSLWEDDTILELVMP
jgi:uncharacterized membrane protein